MAVGSSYTNKSLVMSGKIIRRERNRKIKIEFSL
jgi:hypothetical protein